jgi:hypothetical protein
MSVDEALGLLAVSRDVTKDGLRRAYLRAVRAHPPERDPDGFQRVREAYELLSPIALLRERRAASAQGGSMPVPPTASALPAALRAGASAAEDTTDTVPPAVPPASQELAPDGAADEQERALVAMEEEDWKAAAESLLVFYGRPPPSDVPFPHPWSTLRVVVELYRAGLAKRANKLLDAFDTFTQQYGSSAGALGPPGAVRWTLLRELRELGDIVTPELRVTIADAIADDDLDGLTDELIEWGEAGGSLTRLSEAAPTLYAAVVGQPMESKKTQRRISWVAWAAQIAIVLFVSRHCGDGCTSKSTTVSAPAPPTPVYTPPAAADPQVLEERPPAPASAPPTPQDPKTRLLEAIAKGDCREVGEFFSLWVADLDLDSRAAVRTHAVNMCPELAGTLP